MANNVIYEIDTKNLLKSPTQLVICLVILILLGFIIYVIISTLLKKECNYEGFYGETASYLSNEVPPDNYNPSLSSYGIYNDKDILMEQT